MKNKTYIKIISFLIILLLLISCAKESKKDTLTISYVKTPLNVPSIVERNHSIFQSELEKCGIKKIKYTSIPQGSLQLNALFSGDVDILNAVGASSVLLAHNSDIPIKIISVYSRSPRSFRIYTTDENIKSASDLKGKTIAGSRGSNLHELLLAYLKTAGLNERDVNFVNASLPEALALGLSRKVDCVLLAGSASIKAEEGGLKLLTTGEGLMNGLIVSACTEKFYTEHKDIVNGFKNAQSTVLNYIRGNQEEAFKETAKELDITEDVVKKMYSDYDFSPIITKDDITSLLKTNEFLYENKMLDKKVDINKLIAD